MRNLATRKPANLDDCDLFAVTLKISQAVVEGTPQEGTSPPRLQFDDDVLVLLKQLLALEGVGNARDDGLDLPLREVTAVG